ncbi:MAG: substrate-binding domain-containing protein, partial [Anaerolineae bacterium]|nr:substrate-binding domain-containing protein [Anaerolineae bacterium]
CGSDGLAQGIAIEAQHAGLAIPDQLAVIGFGDSEIAANMRPSLTTVSIKAEEIGRAVVEVLQARLDKQDIPDNKIDVGYTIVARESA